jgi:hypothetical protein
VSSTSLQRMLKIYRSRLSKRGTSRMASSETPTKGRILAALRRSPPVGADLDLVRSREAGRKVDV